MPDLRALLQQLTPNVPLPEGLNTATGTVGIDAAGDVLVYQPPDVIEYAGPGGPFLPISGGQMQGPLLLAADPVVPLGAATRQYVDNAIGATQIAIVVPPNGSIQAAVDQLPATGGKIILSPNATYVLTTTLTITKPNVTIQAPSWNTTIQRAPSFNTNDHLISATTTATGFVIRNVMVDGNSVTGGSFEVNVNGADSLVQHCYVINSGGQGHIAIAGDGSRADGNRVIGTGVGTGGDYGIWAQSGQRTMITNNHVTGTFIDGIGVNGEGTQVLGNAISNCQRNTAVSGGQIVVYPGGDGILIEGNTIDAGGGPDAYGIEIHNGNISIVGNTIINQFGSGIQVDSGSGPGILITGNTICNNGHTAGAVGGIAVYGPLNDLVITSNRISDTQVTQTQAWGVWFLTGPFNNVLIANNDLSGNVSGAIFPPASGTGYIAFHNPGANDAPAYLPNTGGTVDGTLSVVDTLTASNGIIVASQGAQYSGVGTLHLNIAFSWEPDGNLHVYINGADQGSLAFQP